MLKLPTSGTELPKRYFTGKNLNFRAFSNASIGEKTTNEGESSMRSPVRPSSFVSVNLKSLHDDNAMFKKYAP